MNVSLKGKVAVITGAGSGIGLAVVQKYLEADAAGVVAVDVAAQLNEALAQARNQFGARLQTVRGDVAQESTAIGFTRAALQHFGRIDVLVNNAGVACVKPLHEHTPEEWDRVMNVNAKAVYWAARHVVPVMLKSGGGVILNTGSISGVIGIPGQGAYAPSKGALHQLTRQMAVEYAPHNIRVNAIGCGTVDTPLVHRAAQDSGDPEKFWAMLKGNHPLGRIASPEEVAGFYVYMASDLASFFTGAILMMDGGFTAK
jgi:NAD(P)-dependent dehydrogenase (short-subunit alcohol dehydrogenase family)